MKRLFQKKLLPAAIVGVLANVGAAEAIAADQSADSEAFAIEEVIIYARKRAESLQDVPISISAVGAEGLESLGAKKLSDISDVIANVQIGDEMEPDITMRGIYTDARTIGLEQGVGVYINGVYVSRAATNADLAAVERVEVLRGPQGSLFGKNTIAGAVNIVTKKPGENVEGSVLVNVGNYGRQDVRAHIEGALTDTTNGRFSVSSLKNDGHYTNTVTGNDVGGDDSLEVRGDLVIEPESGNLTADLSFDYRKINTLAVTAHLQEAPTEESAAAQAAFITAVGLDPNDISLGSYDYEHDEDYELNGEIWGASATFEYTLPEDYMLTSISARRSTYKDQPIHDDDRLPIFLLNSSQEDRQLFTSQEFRITSPGGEKLDWLAGFYYDNQNLTSSRPIDISSALTYFVTGEFEPLSVTPDSTVETESYALYANLDYHVTDDLTVTLGGRYTREEKSADYSIEGGCLTAGVCIYPQLELELEYEDTSFDPSMSVSYNVNEDITTYFRAATAYKSGGFNVDFIQPEELKIPGTDVYLPVVYTEAPGQTPFDKEEVVSYEWGLKMELLDRRLLLNAAVFQAEYEGFQVSRFNGTSYYIDNAGEATLKGVELDFIGQLSQEWRVIGSLGYLKSEFDVYETADNSGNALDLKGNQFPYAPDWTSSLAVEYTKDFGAYGVVFVRGDYTFKDEIYTSPENTVIEHVGSQEYFNGRISWFNEDESLSVSLWGKNLKDEKHVNYKTLDTTLSGLVYGELAKPRTYGVEVNYIF